MSDWGLSRLIVLSALFSAAVLLLALCRPWLRRQGGAALLYAMWLQVPLMLLVLLLPTPRMPPPLAQVVVPFQLAVTGKPAAAEADRTGHLAATVLAVWAAGVGLSLGLLLVSHAGYRRALRASGSGWRLPAGSSAAMVGLPARLALPEDFRQRYTAMERRMVLAHERIHARRGDNAWTLLAWLLFAMQWFNPLAWWALRRFRADQELACDAAVLQQFPAQRGVYARALMKTQDCAVMALASPCSGHPLVERISMLNQAPVPLRRGLLLGLALCATAGGYAAQMEPRAATVPPGQVRVLMDIQIDGQLFAPLVHLAASDEVREYPIQGADGRRFELQVKANPMPDKDMVMVGMQLKDLLDGKILATPRMAGRDGSMMRMEMRDPGGKKLLMSIDLVARSANWQAVQAAETDRTKAKAER